jgi:REP element-mobilizing transposase RayT
MKKSKQLKFFKDSEKVFGGSHFKKRKGRGRRPLDTNHSMHLVLRSSKATGQWSMLNGRNHKKTEEILYRFARKYGVRIYSFANAGNHLHLHIKLSTRHTYRKFIRAVTAAIAIAITKVSRWNKLQKRLKFWDLRPFSRVVMSWRGFLNMKDYIYINQLEGAGVERNRAQWIIKNDRCGPMGIGV